MHYPGIFFLALFYDYKRKTYFRCPFSYEVLNLDVFRCIGLLLYSVCTLFPVAKCTKSCEFLLRALLSAPAMRLCSPSHQEVASPATLPQSQYPLGPRECGGREAVAALSTAARCMSSREPPGQWKCGPDTPATPPANSQSPNDLAAGHSYINEPGKDCKSCPLRSAASSTGKDGCYFKPLNLGLAC